MKTIPNNIYNNVVIPQTRRLQTSANAEWKKMYNETFQSRSKKERNTIQKINNIRSEVKLFLAIYGKQS